jgi:hypothetical protein
MLCNERVLVGESTAKDTNIISLQKSAKFSKTSSSSRQYLLKSELGVDQLTLKAIGHPVSLHHPK